MVISFVCLLFKDMPLRLLYEVVKSVLVISDLFTEKSQFVWMLDICLELVKTHMPEDEILHQHLIVATCKAASILTPVRRKNFYVSSLKQLSKF